MPLKSQLDLHIEIDVLTAGSTAEVVNAILESLLYQRNQIPFAYKTYRYYVNKWQDQEENESNSNSEGCSVQSFHVQRKKEQATTTKRAISSMRQTIKNVFDRKRIKSLRFLFGSTIFTAKEAYTIHIPTDNIAHNHFHEHHEISPGKLNQTLLSLLTSENLYAIFSHNLNPTNIFLEFELFENNSVVREAGKDAVQIFPKEFLSLPASCKDIHINLYHKQSTATHQEAYKCCKELEVFEDLVNLKLSCSDEVKDESRKKCNKCLTNISTAWWEAEVIVRGFKDQPTKGFNIWS